MIVNGREYGFLIEPFFNKVRAEIYSIDRTFKVPMHISKIYKEFGSTFRLPIESDYKEAREWIDNQLSYIENANKELRQIKITLKK